MKSSSGTPPTSFGPTPASSPASTPRRCWPLIFLRYADLRFADAKTVLESKSRRRGGIDRDEYHAMHVVYHAVSYVVTWGLEHRDLDGVTAIGIDEIAVWSGHKYLTVVYQINEGMRRLLWVGYGRTTASCTAFFRQFGRARSKALEFVSSDMWRACINVVARWAPQVVHVLDRFHIVSRLNDAVDRVRRDERRTLARAGFEPIKNSRWCFLKRPEDLTPAQNDKLRELLRYNLRCVRAYLPKEAFEAFWRYRSPAWASWFLDR